MTDISYWYIKFTVTLSESLSSFSLNSHQRLDELQ